MVYIATTCHGIMVSECVHADDEHRTLESVVRWHHVFKVTWTPWTGQMLQIHAEAGNTQDRYAVATLPDDVIFGHVPCEFGGSLCLHICWKSSHNQETC